MMQIQYTKNLIPGRFELGTTLSSPNRSIGKGSMIWEKRGEADKFMHVSKQHQNHGKSKGWLAFCHHNLLQTELPAHKNLI